MEEKRFNFRNYHRLDWGKIKVLENLAKSSIASKGGIPSKFNIKEFKTIREELKMSRQHLSPNLKKFLTDGIIEKSGDGYKLTPEGMDLYRKLAPFRNCIERCINLGAAKELMDKEVVTIQFLVSPELLPKGKNRKAPK